MKKATIISSLFFLTVIVLSSCKKETEHEHHENELITTVKLLVTKTGTSDTQEFTWADIDGPGGANPVIDEIILESASSYNFNVEFLNESGTAVEDHTHEIEEEGDHHRVFYLPNSISLTFSNLNKDKNGVTLGLSGLLQTGQPGSGSLRLILRHYAGGGKNESDTHSATAASTDVDVSFNVKLN